MSAPNGRKYSADSIIPSSPKPPIKLHDGIPITSEFRPPMNTNVNIMYNVTTTAREIRIARGIFRFGFFISSPACEIISYPSNAINDSPIASAIPVIPSGIKSVKFSDQFGFAIAIATTAATTSIPIIPS